MRVECTHHDAGCAAIRAAHTPPSRPIVLSCTGRLGTHPQVGAADSRPATRPPIHSAGQHQPPQDSPHFLRIPRDSPASTGCDVRTVRHPPHTPGITPRVGTANDRLCHPTTHTLGRPTPTTPGLTTHLRTPWGSTHRLAQPMAAPASRLPIHSAGQHQPPQGSPRILHTPRDLPRQHQPPRDSPRFHRTLRDSPRILRTLLDSPHGLARPIAAPPPDYPHTARQHQPPRDSPRIH